MSAEYGHLSAVELGSLDEQVEGILNFALAHALKEAYKRKPRPKIREFFAALNPNGETDK